MRPLLAILTLATTILLAVQGDVAIIDGKQSAPPVYVSPAPVIGQLNLLVVLVRFNDQGNFRDSQYLQGILDQMNIYFGQNSYGATFFRYDVVPALGSWYLMPQSMSHYGADTAEVSQELVTDGLNLARSSGSDLTAYRYAMIIHAGNDEARSKNPVDIGSFTLPDYTFIGPPLTKELPTSVVAEEDPMGVFAHEAGHLVGLPDLYDYPGGDNDPNNWMDRWELMAVGEWNPRGDPSSQGNTPAELSSWSRIRLGWILQAQVFTVNATQRFNITLERIESPTTGFQAVKIPITVTGYYLLEVRDNYGYDEGLPAGSLLPGLLISLVEESKGNGEGPVRVIDANPGGPLFGSELDNAAFTYSGQTFFSDSSNYVHVTILEEFTSSIRVLVDRSDAPSFPVRIKAQRPGVWVVIDNTNITTNSAGDANFLVHFGPHEVRIQSIVPVTVSLGTEINIGMVDLFTTWDSGSSENPYQMTVNQPTVLTAIYRRALQSSLVMALIAASVLSGLGFTFYLAKRRTPNSSKDTASSSDPAPLSSSSTASSGSENPAIVPDRPASTTQSDDHEA